MLPDLSAIAEYYHGSPHEVKFPDVYYNRSNRDFGRGFYTFIAREDACDWALHKKRAERSEQAFVNRYELCDCSSLTFFFFDRESDEDLKRWIDFVAFNREYRMLVPNNPLGHTVYDLIIGPVADGYLGESFQLLFSGAIPGKTWGEKKDRFLVLLDHNRLSDQFCFKTKVSERKLRFIGADRCYS
jgi:hypothetical protein